MSSWTPPQLQAAVGGRWLTKPVNDDIGIEGVAIDSRTLIPGHGFFAVRGEQFDGHDFLLQALEAGASILIVDDREKVEHHLPDTVPVLLVDDVTRAMADLARVYRRILHDQGVKVIAVTGSNGKTTTRHLIHSVLSSAFTGSQSLRSFNNHMGVPLTLLAVKLESDFVVVEVGSNHPGEIAMLGDIVRPDVVVVTHIGSAHLGHFGSHKAIVREKLSLLSFLSRGGLAVIPNNCPPVEVPDECEVVRFGRLPGSHFALTASSPTEQGIRFTVQYPREQDAFGAWHVNELTLEVSMLGEHNAMNAMTCIPVARWMCLDPTGENFAQALRQAQPVEMRLQKEIVGSVLILNDAYNANPDSVEAALRTLQSIGAEAPRRVAILGDMLELEDYAVAEHQKMGSLIASLERPRIDKAIFIGKLSSHAAKLLPDALCFEQWTKEVGQQVAALIEPGDAILIKGSRSMGMERLLAPIRHRIGQFTSGMSTHT